MNNRSLCKYKTKISFLLYSSDLCVP
ncbi:MAG: hypothetical protein XD92_1521, partial [Proteiniphilum acetatigenes]